MQTAKTLTILGGINKHEMFGNLKGFFPVLEQDFNALIADIDKDKNWQFQITVEIKELNKSDV